MEPSRETGMLNRKITTADSNNIVAILDMQTINSEYQIFEQDYLVKFQTVIEDLIITVNLPGLAEAPWPEVNALMNEAEKMAEIGRIQTEGQKIGLGLYTAIGNEPWKYASQVVLQNQGGSETFVPILVPFLGSNETLLIAGNLKLGVKVEPKWNQPLRANDYLVIKGTWRQVVSFSKKKDDDVEALTARIAAMELALQDRLINLPAGTLLGRNDTTGTVQQIPQSRFVAANNVAIEIKKLEGTTNPIQGGITEIPHGIDPAKVKGFQSVVAYQPGGYALPNDNAYPGYEYSCFVEGSGVFVNNSATNSSLLLSKPVTVLVYYSN